MVNEVDYRKYNYSLGLKNNSNLAERRISDILMRTPWNLNYGDPMKILTKPGSTSTDNSGWKLPSNNGDDFMETLSKMSTIIIVICCFCAFIFIKECCNEMAQRMKNKRR